MSHRASGVSVLLSSTFTVVDRGEEMETGFLLLLCSKLRLSTCSYDKYSMRYGFLMNFEGFLSPSCHARLRKVNHIIKHATLGVIQKRWIYRAFWIDRKPASSDYIGVVTIQAPE